MSKQIALVDIETTGFLNDGGTICEVGIVELDLNTGGRRVVFDSLCVEEPFRSNPFNAWIFQNSDMRIDDVLNAPLFQDLLGAIQNTLNCYPLGVTAYNKNFDFGFLSSRNISIPKELECPMKLATPICGLPSRHPSHGKYKWPKFEEAWAHFFPGEPYVEAHRGADDAMHEARLVHKLYQMGHFVL